MKTAVEELVDKLKPHIHLEWPMNKWLSSVVNEAIKKEKEQIIDAYINYFCDEYMPLNDKRALYKNGEQYYNETYQKK